MGIVTRIRDFFARNGLFIAVLVLLGGMFYGIYAFTGHVISSPELTALLERPVSEMKFGELVLLLCLLAILFKK